MPTVIISQDVAAPVEAVWALLADFGDVSWIPMPSEVRVDGEGPGMSRTISGSDGEPIIETLRWIEPDGRRLAYDITNNPLPVSRFAAVVSVAESPAVAAGCRLSWEIDYEPVGDDVGARESIATVYTMMAGWLQAAAAPAAPTTR